jgi:hypothetical protein
MTPRHHGELRARAWRLVPDVDLLGREPALHERERVGRELGDDEDRLALGLVARAVVDVSWMPSTDVGTTARGLRQDHPLHVIGRDHSSLLTISRLAPRLPTRRR